MPRSIPEVPKVSGIAPFPILDDRKQSPVETIGSRLTLSIAIQKYAGRDASATYNSIHAPSLLQNELGPSKRIGDFDASSAPPGSDIFKEPEGSSAPAPRAKGERRPLQSIISSYDFEEAAAENLSEKAWAFYSSAATDCVTKEANTKLFERIWLRPRILRNVRDISTRTNILGVDIPIPLFASPTAMVKLTHPDGELSIARGCSNLGVPQTVSLDQDFPS